MRGRGKAQNEHIIALAHKTEWMSRQKRLKDLEHYLKPMKKVSGTGVATAMAKFERQGLNVRVKRIERDD
jgi:hypothetical protein